jgi:hypothetical protein
VFCHSRYLTRLCKRFVPAGCAIKSVQYWARERGQLNVVLVDMLTTQGPDGKPQDTLRALRVAALVPPAKKTGTDATVPMVFSGFASNSSNVPGAYTRKRDDGSFEAVHHRLIGIASREDKRSPRRIT